MKPGGCISFAATLALALASGLAVAGTPDLDGAYSGTYGLTVRTTSAGATQGNSTNSYDWEWNFNSATKVGTVTFQAGTLTPTNPPPPGPFSYTVTAVGSTTLTTLPVIDIGGGYYLVPYRFRVTYADGLTRDVNTYARFEITDNSGILSIDAVDIDGDSITGIDIPASSSSPPFPTSIQQDWYGVAN